MTIKTRGLNRLVKRLERIERPGRHMADPARKTADIVYTRARVYAPPIAGSKYVRTYTLRASFSTEIKQRVRSVMIRVFSRGAVSPRGQRYDHYVKGPQSQARIHRNRWSTTRQDLSFTKGAIIDVWRQFIRGL